MIAVQDHAAESPGIPELLLPGLLQKAGAVEGDEVGVDGQPGVGPGRAVDVALPVQVHGTKAEDGAPVRYGSCFGHDAASFCDRAFFIIERPECFCNDFSALSGKYRGGAAGLRSHII